MFHLVLHVVTLDHVLCYFWRFGSYVDATVGDLQMLDLGQCKVQFLDDEVGDVGVFELARYCFEADNEGSVDRRGHFAARASSVDGIESLNDWETDGVRET